LTQRLPRSSSARLPALPQCTIGGVTTAGGVVPSSARLAPSRSRLAAANSMSVAMANHRHGSKRCPLQGSHFLLPQNVDFVMHKA
jgi:hypothetical protein